MSTLKAQFRLQRGGFTLDAGFELPARGITAVFGPSGSGKTTILRCLAGLEPGARGQLHLDGSTWQDDSRGIFLAAHRRPVGYVFQDARLFPHLRVRRNLDYGCRRSGGCAPPHFARVVELLGIGQLLDRYPLQLSGGEQQRVAIGRALLTQPRLLLMDEPLAAVDMERKSEILPYLQDLHRALDIPVVYVTHALDEVTRLAEHLILIGNGSIQATGRLADLLSRLELPLAHSEDAAALIEARVATHDNEFELTELEFAGGRLSVGRQAAPIGERVRVLVYARDVSLALDEPQQSSILNILRAEVAAISQEGRSRVTVRLRVGETYVLARITRKSCVRLNLAPGTRVYAQIKSVALAG